MATWVDKNGVVHASEQPDFDLDGVGDACDTDADGDSYQVASAIDPLTGAPGTDCDDRNAAINPGAPEVHNNGRDDDCNPATPDKPYDVRFDMPGYDGWLPTDGATATVSATVVGAPAGAVVSPVTLTVTSVTSHPGKYSNDPSGDTSADYSWTVGADRITFTSHDHGGSVTVRGEATITLEDGTVILAANTFTLPKDTDGDGLPDAWESLFGDLARDDDIDRSHASTVIGDGLTNFAEYRGFVWGPAMVRIDPAPDGVYQTTAFVPAGSPGHFRTDPRRKDLFIRYDGYGAAAPFAVGAAFHNAGIDVHAVDAAAASAGAERSLDALLIANRAVYGFDDGRINKRSKRDWTWDTKGAAGRGDASVYGIAETYQQALDGYFADRPYADDPARGFVGRLDAIETDPAVNTVEDTNDNGVIDTVKGRSEDANPANSRLDGDVLVLGWTTSALGRLSVFDIDGNGRVELPVRARVADIDRRYEYTAAQVLKHTITHELGHAAGASHNQDAASLMYEYSPDWSRDGSFGDYAASQLLIHNR